MFTFLEKFETSVRTSLGYKHKDIKYLLSVFNALKTFLTEKTMEQKEEPKKAQYVKAEDINGIPKVYTVAEDWVKER